jgi:hypothetical protein
MVAFESSFKGDGGLRHRERLVEGMLMSVKVE